MGGKVAKNINAHPTFCAASSDETDRLKYLFDLKDFGETKEKRFDYFDDLLNENEDLLAVFHELNIVWPSSFENFENEKFLENLTADQATAILKALNI